MNIGKAILMGIVQGITEFLPVSSSGHLALLKGIFDLDTDTGVLFDVMLHVATLVAVCVVFRKDVVKIFLELIGFIKDVFHNAAVYFKKITGALEVPEYRHILSSPYRKFVVLLIVSTIPTGILGILLKDIVEYASNSLLVTGICFFGTGLVLLLSDFLPEGIKRQKETNYGDAMSIGIAQGIATLPGLSRSGVTITAGMLCGLERKFAVKYSFIMSIPAILGAMILELFDIGNEHITGSEVGCCFVGMIFAAVIGFFALQLLIKFVQSKFFKYFAYYCFGIGVIAIISFLILR